MTLAQAVAVLVLVLAAFGALGVWSHDPMLLVAVGFSAVLFIVTVSSPWWIEIGRNRWNRFQKSRRCR